MIPAATRTRARGRHDQGGYVLVMVSFSLSVIVLMAAISVDVGSWYNVTSKAQRAADSSALSAVSEMYRQRKAGATTTAAQTAARSVAMAIAKEAGFDDAKPQIIVTVTFSTGAGGADRVVVKITQSNLPLFFSRWMGRSPTVTRSSAATLSQCQARCNQSLVVRNELATVINTSTGGDGWQAQIAGDYVFNLYHHDSGPTLFCYNKMTNAICGSMYPVEPYVGMLTNYTSKITPLGTKVYFVVQTTTSAGLGCWDGATNARCTGFTTPRSIAAYKSNPDKNALTRMDGPELIGDRLFMYGDDNRMYCYNTTTNGWCTGYPKNTSLAATRNMKLVSTTAGFAGGVDGDGGIQFDMLPHPDGRIFLSLGPTTGDNRVWTQCWDTRTDAACTGYTNASFNIGRPILSFNYDATGIPTAVCGRAAKRGGGSGSGMQCVTLTGAPTATEVTYAFDTSSGQQEASGMTSDNRFVTYFPYTGSDTARCWDWTNRRACSVSPPNWSNTSDYAYTYTGNLCILALGHTGKMWTFNITNGQYPCNDGPAGVVGRLYPCTCRDGVTTRWTSLNLNTVTELEDFSFFIVTIKLPDGTVWRSTDLVQTKLTTIDLSQLNSMSPVPEYVDVSIRAQALTGRSEEVFTLEQNGVGLASGMVPTLVE